ncbi:hypothetical protein [Anaerosporobacter sp.]
MKNLSVMEQKQVIGGIYYKIFRKDGSLIAKVTSYNTLMDELDNNSDAYKWVKFNDSGTILETKYL